MLTYVLCSCTLGNASFAMTVPAVVALSERRDELQRRKTDEVDRLFDLSLDMLGTASEAGFLRG